MNNSCGASDCGNNKGMCCMIGEGITLTIAYVHAQDEQGPLLHCEDYYNALLRSREERQAETELQEE